MSRNADAHPEHDRGGCKEHDPAYNADADGSNGCARCTALLMDQRDDLLEALQAIVKDNEFCGDAWGERRDAWIATAQAAIAKATGSAA